MITPYGSYGLDDSLKPAGNEYGATRECVVNSTGKYAVTNGVYERGYRYASLGVKSQSCPAPRKAGFLLYLRPVSGACPAAQRSKPAPKRQSRFTNAAASRPEA